MSAVFWSSWGLASILITWGLWRWGRRGVPGFDLPPDLEQAVRQEAMARAIRRHRIEVAGVVALTGGAVTVTWLELLGKPLPLASLVLAGACVILVMRRPPTVRSVLQALDRKWDTHEGLLVLAAHPTLERAPEDHLLGHLRTRVPRSPGPLHADRTGAVLAVIAVGVIAWDAFQGRSGREQIDPQASGAMPGEARAPSPSEAAEEAMDPEPSPTPEPPLARRLEVNPAAPASAPVEPDAPSGGGHRPLEPPPERAVPEPDRGSLPRGADLAKDPSRAAASSAQPTPPPGIEQPRVTRQEIPAWLAAPAAR